MNLKIFSEGQRASTGFKALALYATKINSILVLHIVPEAWQGVISEHRIGRAPEHLYVWPKLLTLPSNHTNYEMDIPPPII